MNFSLTFLIDTYRKYKVRRNTSRAYRVFRVAVLSTGAAYLLLLCFPQVLFAHQVSERNFMVYSRQPIDQSIHAVLDKAEAGLATSEINDPQVRPKIFLTNSSRLYSVLGLYVGSNSFGKGYPLLPTNNVFINRSDLSQDLVFRDAPSNNSRSLSGVIAHETAHLLIRRKVGYWRNFMMPDWKKEGYDEYVAGGSTLSHEAGVRMWKQNPSDATGYQYFKYYQLVKYLLEQEKISVEDLFHRDFDLQTLEEKVLQTL